MNLKADFKVINLYQCDPGFRTSSRIFDYEYLLYIHKGTGSFIIGNTKYDASIGDIFYCPSFTQNIIIADQDNPFLLSGLEFTVNQDVSGNICRHINLLTSDFLIKIINVMVHEYSYNKMFSSEICNSLFDVLLRSLIRLSNSAVSNQDVKGQILDYIVSNIHRPVTHQELSKVFSYHKNSINRFILNETGLSLKNYQIELRIKKASELLEYSNKPIYEIAGLCGYSSPIFFSNQFKAKTGITPRSFRKQKQNRQDCS